jgi:hypothetical protein
MFTTLRASISDNIYHTLEKEGAADDDDDVFVIAECR